MRFPFSCRSSAADAGHLGVHDGIDTWAVNTAQTGDHDVQLYVSRHESHHHELVIGTAWGVLTSILGTLGDATHVVTHADMFLRAAMWSTEVHETYATYFGVGADLAAVPPGTISDLYAERYHRADQLCPDPDAPWANRSLFAFAALRCAMSPPGLAELLATPLAEWRSADLLRCYPDRPDQRWEVIREHRQRLWELSALRDLDAEGLRTLSGPDVAADFAAALRTAGGLGSLAQEEMRSALVTLLPQVTAIVGEHERYEIAERSHPAVEDLDRQQRERLQFRSRPLRVVPVSSPAADASAFASHHPEIGVFSVLYWLRSDLLERQVLGALSLEPQVFALLSIAARVRERGEVLCWTVDARLGPAMIALILERVAGRHRMIVVTTLATLADAIQPAEHVARVYALIDIPVLGLLQSWLAADATVTWYSSWIDGPHPSYVFAFEVSASPGIVQLHITSSAGREAMLGWLQAESRPGFAREPDLGTQIMNEVSALVQHVTSSWWFVDQRGRHAKGASRAHGQP